MAVKKNTKQATKSTAKTTKTTKATPRKKKSANDAIKKELISIVVIAVSIFLILGIFTDGAGAIGNIISAFLRGLFGIGAYLLPIVMIVLSIYVLFDEKKTIPLSKIVMGIVLFLLVISFVHILNFEDGKSFTDPADYLFSYYNNGAVTNGGLFGAVLGNFILKLLGYIGSFILLITSIIVLTVVITGRSFIEGVANGYNMLRDRFASEDDYEDEYDYEDYDDYEDDYYEEVYEERPLPKKKVLKSTPLPHKTEVKRKGAEIYDFEDEKYEERKRVKIDLPLEGEYKPKPQLKSALDIEFSLKDEEMPAPAKGLIFDIEPKEDKEEVYIETVKAEPEVTEPAVIKAEPEIPVIHEPVIRMPEVKTPEPELKEEIRDDIAFKGVGIEGADSTSAVEEISPVLAATEEELAQAAKESKPEKQYIFPPIDLLKENPERGTGTTKAEILANSQKLEDTLKSFGVAAKVVEVTKGPTVTRYELSPGQGVKVSKISNLADDLALNLAANGIRIEAPIPGKAAVGIEVPNAETQSVYFREVIDDEENAFQKFPSNLAFGLGKDIAGEVVVADIGKMPHMLIAGATGSGKSVCINTLICSLIYKSSPEDVKLIMIDPKVVELSVYNGIPHLMIPVVTDPKKAAGALNWAVREMLQRYELFATSSVRDLKGYNALVAEHGGKKLPQIVIIIDELADLMMAAPGEVEDAICRLAQMARAAGLHLIIATQRPSVDVITGVIKANIPSRLAFSVSSGVDSRTILDMVGAEKLLGKGDMLFYPIGMNKPMRVQGAFISDKEVESIVEFLKKNAQTEYDPEIEKQITSSTKSASGGADDDADELFEEAVEFVIQKEKASASMLQRQFRIGYNRAARLVDYLQDKGIVGPEDGSKPRKVLINSFQWQEMKEGKTESEE